MSATDNFLQLPTCENEIVGCDERHMHSHLHFRTDCGLRYTTTIALSHRSFSGSGLELIELPSIRLISPEKILAIGLYLLAHGNSHLKIGQTFNVGKSVVIEAAQDVVGSLYELWDDYIKFPENLPRP